MPAWDSLDPKEKKFQARLMEVYAGFLEHTDTQVGKLVDELERQGLRDNTLIFYVFSDNGASAEGMQGSIAELNAQNGIAAGAQQHMAVLERDYGGLDALGGPKLDSMYHAAWAWAGMTPFQGTKLVAGYFGGTRTPLAVSWPKKIKPDARVRSQFHHLNDIVPTIYEMAGVTLPQTVDGIAQDPLDGVSMASTFADAKAVSRKPAQYFENLGSRGLYKDGWMASVWGPRTPWVAGCRPVHGLEAGQRHLGAVQARRRLFAGGRCLGREPAAARGNGSASSTSEDVAVQVEPTRSSSRRSWRRTRTRVRVEPLPLVPPRLR